MYALKQEPQLQPPRRDSLHCATFVAPTTAVKVPLGHSLMLPSAGDRVPGALGSNTDPGAPPGHLRLMEQQQQ